MSKELRYRLQKKQAYSMPNILGNKSYPVPTYRWVDIYVSDSEELLKEIIKGKDPNKYRIEDSDPYGDSGKDGESN